MRTTMTYALDIIEEEKQKLEKCLSNWDIENYPDARANRDNKLNSLKMVFDLITMVNNGINPLENGMFSHLSFEVIDCGKDGLKTQCKTCLSVIK